MYCKIGRVFSPTKSKSNIIRFAKEIGACGVSSNSKVRSAEV